MSAYTLMAELRSRSMNINVSRLDQQVKGDGRDMEGRWKGEGKNLSQRKKIVIILK